MAEVGITLLNISVIRWRILGITYGLISVVACRYII